MRSLILLLLGVVIGAIGAASVVNALRQRDAYPRGLMNVLQHHYVSLREGVRARRCDDAPAHLATLRTLAGEIEAAVYPDEVADAPFREYLTHLRAALDAVPATADCAALAPALPRIGNVCEDCHRQYR